MVSLISITAGFLEDRIPFALFNKKEKGKNLKTIETTVFASRKPLRRTDLVELFAFLHDSRRLNEGLDPGHGKRAVHFARSLHGTFFELEPEDLAVLEFACEFHTDGLLESDVTVQTCWDADRLDLGRVGNKPSTSKLCTDAAKTPEMIDWAYRRSLQR